VGFPACVTAAFVQIISFRPVGELGVISMREEMMVVAGERGTSNNSESKEEDGDIFHETN
jgi:hypothetical protein